MADENEIGVRITVKGGEDAKREIKAITANLNTEAKALDKAADERQTDAARGVAGAGGQAAAGRGGVAGGVFLGALGAQIANASFSAISAGIAQSFDPNLSQFEKDFAKLEGAARGIPLVGEILAAQTRAENQVQLGAVQGINALVNNQIGPAAQAIGLANPNASDERLTEILEEQLDKLIREIVELQLPGERAQELASQIVVRRIDEALGGLRPVDPSPGAALEKGVASVETVLGVIQLILQAMQGDFKSMLVTSEKTSNSLERLTNILGGSR